MQEVRVLLCTSLRESFRILMNWRIAPYKWPVIQAYYGQIFEPFIMKLEMSAVYI